MGSDVCVLQCEWGPTPIRATFARSASRSGRAAGAHATRAERRRQAIASRVAAQVPGLDRVVTASMGMVEQPEGGALRADFATLYGHCDRLLYEAKHTGRNRTMREKMQSFGAGRKAHAA